MVKEVDTLLGYGYGVNVICCFYQSWALKYDKEITSGHPGIYHYCGGNPHTEKFTYFKTRLRQKLALTLFKYFRLNFFAEAAISRTHAEALRLAKKIPADLYIAHNLGALPAAAQAARKLGVPIGYDAEDMHSGQYTSPADYHYQLNKYIEKIYFPATKYFTAASPLIGQYYQELYPYLSPIIINNVFPKTQLNIKRRNDQQSAVKLFWFSQTVGPERGIETILKAMSGLSNKVQLHLLGHCSASDKEALNLLAKESGLQEWQLYFHEPIPAHDIFNFASQFDIGMATETGIPLNRDICLTNKIFTYIQCGLALIASNTQAQQLFLKQYPDSGNLYQINNEVSLRKCLNVYLSSPDLLYQTRLLNYQLGQTTLNWETERMRFMEVINNL